MLSTRIQALTTRANEIGAEWIGCGVGVHCAGAFREQFSRRRISLPKHTEVKAKFTMICDTASATFSQETLQSLRLPAFDSYAWSDEQLLLLLHGMFTELELTSTFRIKDAVLRQFLYEVYKHYNEVPFHNFRHCFCVAQMMYSMAWKVDLISRLGHLEVLVLLVSCICHDLDHPGYNNIYQINARTELAIRYNDISPLENHHCSVAFRILELAECNILEGLPSDTYRQVREGIIRCILATDMARHNEILAQFRDVTPCFDYDNKTHTNLLSMVMIKVADISNEARPIDVAEPWLDRLLQEFFAQSAAGKTGGLPVTLFMDPDKVSKPSSQVRFIGLVLLPLFEAWVKHMPELQDLIVQPVRDALEYYRRLNEATREGRSRKSLGDGLEPANASQSIHSPTGSQTGPQTTHNVRSRRSLVPRMSLSISRSTETHIDDNQVITIDPASKTVTPEMAQDHHIPSTHDIERFMKNRRMDEGDEIDADDGREGAVDDDFEENDSGDSETATEVEVSEKTLKFKIATEGGGSSMDRRNSRIGIPSRKNSHERCTLSHAFGNASYSLDLQKYDYRRGSLGPSSSGGSLGNFCSNCQTLENTNRCCRVARNSDGSVRSPCSDTCQRSQGSAGSHSVRQISEEFEPETEEDQKRSDSVKQTKSPDQTDTKTNLSTSDIQQSVIQVPKDVETKLESNDDKSQDQQQALSPNPDDSPTKQNFDEITIDKTIPVKQELIQQQPAPPRSLFARLKNFTDRLSLSFDKQYTSRNNNTSDDVFRENNLTATRASTLPKSKRVEARKTWKILMYNKDRNTTNSIDVLTDVVDNNQSKDNKEKVEI
ncbi:LOW QUALITY PROTEIN: high affinity cGMP-specific 3',5'-cyclic phosphodiesterase 9A-like [Ctenocephalides felis]|uniref:LOW QUALITY PROTEIN: high affinity cGMP-specific 3',5'-cyclic phosphodiesterase 9A-like n=1 Tax=Ctenocephalides felis TaxID=7515 RepID=UPI000E6E18BF|nr:LOW QUALITY PROTEIN: high affinity cGMP-specific 3',5'-cyclic phosphodiesterase 9A-like [Ctenocephalides felis]